MAAALVPLLVAVTFCPGLLVPMGDNPFEFHKAAWLWINAAAALAACAGSPAAWRAIRRLEGWRLAAVACASLTLVAAAASAVLSQAPALAWWGSTVRAHGALTEGALLVMFAVAIVDADEDRVRLMQWALILGSVVPTAYGLSQMAHVNPLAWNVDRLNRPTSTFGNPLFLAGYLATVLPLTLGRAIALFRSSTGLRARATAGALSVLCGAQLAVLMADGSRGPALALAAAAGLAALLIGFISLQGALRRAAAAMALVASIAFVVAAPRMMRPADVGAVARGADNPDAGNTAVVRLLLWRAMGEGMRVEAKRLWIGLGSEAPTRLLSRYADAGLPQIEGPDIAPDRSHNDTLDRLASYGIAGLTLQAVVVIVALGAALAGLGLLPRAQAGRFVALSAAACAVVAGLALASGGWWALALMMPVAVVVIVSGWIVWSPPSREACRFEIALMIVAAIAAWFAHVIDVSLSVSTIASDLNGMILLAIVIGAATRAPRAGTPVVTSSFVPGAAGALAGWAVAAAFVIPRASSDVLAQRANAVRGTDAAAAVALFHEAGGRDRSSAPLQTELGDTLMGAGRFAEAADALLRARQIDPFDYHRPRNLAALERRWAFALPAGAREPHQDRADRWYREAVEAAPNFSALWAEWSNLEIERGRLNGALSKLERSAALGATGETMAVGDAILRAQGRDVEDKKGLRKIGTDFRNRGYPALAALYERRAAAIFGRN